MRSADRRELEVLEFHGHAPTEVAAPVARLAWGRLAEEVDKLAFALRQGPAEAQRWGGATVAESLRRRLLLIENAIKGLEDVALGGSASR